MLLIDDIQFIQNKEQTQEEFFHTFNELHQNKKQIVISSDRPPKEIAKLEDRLRSRFEWGLIVDITPPDYETRMAILQKNRRREFRNSSEALNYIANQIQSNIRELEGALTRLLAYSKLQGRPITTELAEALKDIIQVPKSKKLQSKIFKSRWTLLQRSHRRFQRKNVQNQLLIHVKLRCIYQENLPIFHYLRLVKNSVVEIIRQ